MKAKRRRTIDPAKAREAVTGGWYEEIKPTARGYLCCGRCNTESATVPAPGEPCLACKLEERKAAREASS